MRRKDRFTRVGLALFLIPVFLSTALLYGVAPADAAPAKSPPSTQQPAPSQSATISGTDPLAVPEDPLGQQSEQQTPEISISVDVRDGHLVVRVVDVWGPGRVTLVMRSWTGVGNSPSGAGYWQFNHQLNASGGNILEPEGNQAVYKFSSRNCNTAQTECWDTYVKDIGTYGTEVVHNNCVWTGKEGNIFSCTPDAYTVNRPKGVTQQFGGNGRITRQQDANSNSITYAYTTTLPNQSGSYLATVTDPVGRPTAYGYEASDYNAGCVHQGEICHTAYRVKTATDSYGQVTTYTYAAPPGTPSPLASVTNAAGFITRYSYDGSGRLTSVTDARGFTTAITWTPTTPARVAQVTAPDGKATTYDYTLDVNGNVTGVKVTDANTKATNYEVTTAGDITRITDPLGYFTQFFYDSRHNFLGFVDARGRVTGYTYNTHNKLTQVVRDSGTCVPGVTGCDELNLTTNLSWDSPDTTPLKENLLSVTNPRGISTNYAYDANNNLTSVRRAVGTVDEALTQYAYTTWGGVASVIDPRGNTTTSAYTARHQIQTVTPPVGGATTYSYDTLDNQVTMTDGNGHAWQTEYDARRLVTSATDPAGNRTSFEYDANGNRTRAVDAQLQATLFSYDSRNRLTTITDPLNGPNHPTGYLYDAVGNLIKITNARNFSTNFGYDAANRLTQVTDALGQVTSYGYDQVGNRTSMLDRKAVTHFYTYDAVNRLAAVSAGGYPGFSYTYDADSNRLTMTDSTGTTNYTYDMLDRLTKTAYPDVKSVQYGYDKASNRTSLTYPGGTASLTYAYDAANRLSQITQGTLQWTFTYDGAGNRTRLTHPNGTQTVYAYRTNNWLSSISHQTAGGTPFEAISYTYDANGNRISQTDSSGTSSYGYDPLNRLISAAYPGTYGTWSWEYDAVGNRTQQQVAPAVPTTYTYDGNNRLTQAGAVVYSYDANGNLTGTSAGQSFRYDAFDRMTQAASTGGTVTYSYNGDGLKIQRIGPDGTTRYYYDGFRPIWETDGAGAMTAQLDRDIFGNLLSRAEPTNRRYYHTDGLGSTVALTSEAGSVTASMLYDAWGNVRTSGADIGKYRFAGAELDTASGLYHMGARFYDPSIGRWLSEDPVQSFEPASLNFYAYVANNPLILTDPAGMMPTRCDGGCTPSRQEVVVGWVNEHGKDEAQKRVRDAWKLLDRILVALNAAGIDTSGLSFRVLINAVGTGGTSGYIDVNATAGKVLNITVGLMLTRTGQRHFYLGMALGTPDLTITGSLSSVTPGWNIAFTGAYKGAAIQVGTNLGCFAKCGYIELGAGTTGVDLMAFYVW